MSDVPDVIKQAEYALEWGNGDRLHAELVAELKAARAEVDAVRAFADELENGAPSIIARSFAAEIRRRLRGEAR